MMKEHGPLLGQIYVQMSYAAMFLITRVALTQGMSHYIFVLYRQIVATLAITPFAFFLETMNNLNPAATFLVAILLRLEKLDLWTQRGQAKVWGTFFCVGGAIVMTLIKGPSLTGQNTQTLIPPVQGDHAPGNWILGSLLLVGGVWAWSACVIYQAWIVAGDCPSQLTSTAVMCWTGTLQSVVVALLFEKRTAWRLSWDLQLLSIIYSGIFCSAFGLFIQMWCVEAKGPVFSTVFSPLSTVLVAILEPLLLHVKLHWGSLVGMVVVVGGLYSVLWGKAMEEEKTTTRKTGRDGIKRTSDSEAEPNITEPLLTQGRGDRIEI